MRKPNHPTYANCFARLPIPTHCKTAADLDRVELFCDGPQSGGAVVVVLRDGRTVQIWDCQVSVYAATPYANDPDDDDGFCDYADSVDLPEMGEGSVPLPRHPENRYGFTNVAVPAGKARQFADAADVAEVFFYQDGPQVGAALFVVLRDGVTVQVFDDSVAIYRTNPFASVVDVWPQPFATVDLPAVPR